MQTTIYYRERDQYLLNKLLEQSKRERKSKSACILSILEKYFESQKRVGEILLDLGALNSRDLSRALDKQREEGGRRKIGEVLTAEGYVAEDYLHRALEVQKLAG